MNEFKIVDDSGDKAYFTIIPNYIANHSAANDQALYLQMKRFAGETGECFATQETLMEKLGIGVKAYRKSLDYILEKKWVTYIGMTRGKTRPVKTYKVSNIWDLNTEHYKKIPSERTLSMDDKKDTSQKNSKIPAESTVEEEPPKEEQRSFLENSSYEEIEIIPTDDDGNEIPQKKARISRNKVALTLQRYYNKEAQEIRKTGARYDSGMAGYTMLTRLLKTYTEVDVRRILDYYIDSKKFDEYPHLGAALSQDSLRRFEEGV